MKNSLFKKITAIGLSLTLAVGMTGVVSAAVKKGTDISNGVRWQSYSIHTREDKGEWEDQLKKEGQFYNINVTEASGLNANKAYGENAKIATQTSTGFNMNVISTGWSANWKPTKNKDKDGNAIWECAGNNPWGVTATKILNIEKGRTYTVSFKIKSTLKNEITETKERKDGTTYNVGTGKYNYIKHVHVKAYRNHEKDGDPALDGVKMTATYKGKNVLSTTPADGTKTKYTVIALDSRNDDYVDVKMTFTIPGDNLAYKQKTMGIKFAMGALLYSFPNENNMNGNVEVKDFTVIAGTAAPTAKAPTLKAKKKAIAVKAKKVKGAKKYEYQYATKKTFEGKKKVSSKKNKVTLKNKKKIKSKKTVYVRVRYYKNGIWSVWSKAKKVKVK